MLPFIMDWINQFLLACGRQKKEKRCCRSMWIFPSLQKGKDSSQQRTLHELIFSQRFFSVCVRVSPLYHKRSRYFTDRAFLKRGYIYRVNFSFTASGASLECFGRSDPEEMQYKLCCRLKLETQGWQNNSL